MTSSKVQQLGALSDLFAEAISFRRPASLAVLGVAGGNGLDRIDSNLTRRVVGLDINAQYLDSVRRRYSHLAGLELHCIDLAQQVAELQPVELVHAALVFEHAGTGLCLDNAASLVATNGALSIVLQLPASTGQDVGKTGFASIERLASKFSLIDAAQLRAMLQERSFQMKFQSQRSLPAGKEFWMGIFARE